MNFKIIFTHALGQIEPENGLGKFVAFTEFPEVLSIILAHEFSGG